jgi:predicted Zn-dependent protease
MVVDPCAPQPITEIAATTVWLGDGAAARAAPSTRAAWERSYEHGMALTQVIGERLDEARGVLEHALTVTPAGPDGDRPRAMILVQLASVAGKQGRADDALALIARARALLPAPGPAALDAYAAEALARVWRWAEAEPFARAWTDKAPANVFGWIMLARVRGSLADDHGALAAAKRGLALSPRDPDLLRSQATALAKLMPGSDLAAQALTAYDRFRAPDAAAQLRMACAAADPVCAREREFGHTHALTLAR